MWDQALSCDGIIWNICIIMRRQWHRATADSTKVSQLQGRQFNPELSLLCEEFQVSSPCPCGFPPNSQKHASKTTGSLNCRSEWQRLSDIISRVYFCLTCNVPERLQIPYDLDQDKAVTKDEWMKAGFDWWVVKLNRFITVHQNRFVQFIRFDYYFVFAQNFRYLFYYTNNRLWLFMAAAHLSTTAIQAVKQLFQEAKQTDIICVEDAWPGGHAGT